MKILYNAYHNHTKTAIDMITTDGIPGFSIASKYKKTYVSVWTAISNIVCSNRSRFRKDVATLMDLVDSINMSDADVDIVMNMLTESHNALASLEQILIESVNIVVSSQIIICMSIRKDYVLSRWLGLSKGSVIRDCKSIVRDFKLSMQNYARGVNMLEATIVLIENEGAIGVTKKCNMITNMENNKSGG